ncbi:carboxylesterase family protein [Lignipirellula cremea]|uniref:Esterase n=1 Tax=Lignipirellula cremea TaxID=2528010 RepID=A0A518DX68_9BACT|nr:prolyl oligopeptidase family serine peptidase [Lignipirellula cremea]QDU96412.1 esterase [Lignipirellula cremea]
MRRSLLCLSWLLCFSPTCLLAAEPGEVPAPTRAPHFEKFEFESDDGVKLAYWLMTPEKIEPGKSYPLLLALHGRGGNTQAPGYLAEEKTRQSRPCFVMAPAVSKSEVWGVPAGLRLLRGKQRIGVALAALDTVLENYPIDQQRIYVTGQSMGGFGTFAAVAQRPELFAAAVPICGGWDPADAEKLKSTPLWAFHGSADKTVPAQRSQEMIEAIKKAGGSPKYTEYPGVGHGSWVPTYASAEMWDWMFDQKRLPADK